ncbi:hypothetical protein PHET_09212 [Paragonimus heterotremus]|uniref:Coiled-coil domain-containing protein 39 n=1 Tax=Paragonimus heterotremus TaxID=100268 RepID=A0A8J4WLK8_9TREM|nr:hypothetical protein PHET_09212 [Paragonimus heterotremus]
METRLNQLRNQVMSEETRQLQLDALEHEVDAELNARKNCMQVELRQMESRLVETKAELTSRQRRLDQIRARYNVTVIATGTANEDALGARMRYLLEALQERQDLKHKGDTLDAQVRRAEEELRALENTVVVMGALNEEARGKLKLREEDEPLITEKREIEKKLTDAQDKITSHRENRRRLRGNILHCEMQLEELNALMEIVKQRLHTAGLHMEKATRTVEESKQRYERAGRILSQVMERLNRFFRANQADIEVSH